MRAWHVVLATAVMASVLAPTARADPVGQRAAATPLGQVLPTATTCDNLGVHPTYLQVATPTGGVPYAAPGPGVITSFSTFQPASIRVRGVVLRPGGAANIYTVAGLTETRALGSTGILTLPARIPVQAGDRLALQGRSLNFQCFGAAPTGNVMQPIEEDSFDPGAPGAVADFNGIPFFNFTAVDVAATFEPDADGDGYGDVTQDACPESAAVHAACSRPDTTQRGKTKRRVSTKVVSLKFGSPTAGATFSCRIDKLAARACSSPFLARYKTGKHVVTITATDPVSGLADLTPLVVKFKVAPPQAK